MRSTVAFLVGGLLLGGMGWALVRDGRRQLGVGRDGLRSSRARGVSEVAAGAVFALYGLAAALIVAWGGRVPTGVGTPIAVSLLVLFALAVAARAVGGVAAAVERREAARRNRALGTVAPRRLWSPWGVLVLWAVLMTVACVAWSVVWVLTHPHQLASQTAVSHALNVVLAVGIPAAIVHMGIQLLRRSNRRRQLDVWSAGGGEDPIAQLCPSEATIRPNAVRCGLLWLSRVGISDRAPLPDAPRCLRR